MSHPKQSTHSNDKSLSEALTTAYKKNRRKSTRYVRNDIGVTVYKKNLFNFSFTKDWGIAVKLIDISSRGASITAPERLNIRKKLNLNIRFADFTEFNVPGSIVRTTMGNTYSYGIKFDQINEGLADHLLKTQRRLKFK